MLARRTARSSLPLATTALVALGAAGACDVSTDPDLDTFTVSFATDPAPVDADPAEITVTGGGHTLVITSVDYVIDDAGLERFSTTIGCSTASEPECTVVALSPVLVSLPIGGDGAPVVTPIEARFRERVYEALEFDLHTPLESVGDDDVFLQANPTFEGVSVRVEGSYDDTPFVLERAIDSRIEILFAEVFIGDERANLTVAAAVGDWFLSAGDTPVPFDPATAVEGGANDARFVSNVVSSFRAFRDFDQNGVFDGDDLDT